MRLGHIITDERIKPPLFVEVTKVDRAEVNPHELTLIVGKETVKRFYPDFELKYLDRRVSENVYWTFSKYEKRNMHDDDLDRFSSLVETSLRRKVKYVPISFMSNSYTYAKNILSILFGDKEKVVMYIGKTVYILVGSTVYGIFIDEIAYIGLSETKIVNVLSRIPNAKFVYSLDFLKGREKGIKPGDLKFIPYLLKTPTAKRKTI